MLQCRNRPTELSAGTTCGRSLLQRLALLPMVRQRPVRRGVKMSSLATMGIEQEISSSTLATMKTTKSALVPVAVSPSNSSISSASLDYAFVQQRWLECKRGACECRMGSASLPLAQMAPFPAESPLPIKAHKQATLMGAMQEPRLIRPCATRSSTACTAATVADAFANGQCVPSSLPTPKSNSTPQTSHRPVQSSWQKTGKHKDAIVELGTRHVDNAATF